MNEFEDLYQKTLKDYIWLATGYDAARQYLKSSSLRLIRRDLEALNEWQNYYLEQSYVEEAYQKEVVRNADLKLKEYMNGFLECDDDIKIVYDNKESRLYNKVLRAVVLRMLEKNEYGYSKEDIFNKAVLVTESLLGISRNDFPNFKRTFNYLFRNGFLSDDGMVLEKASYYIANVRKMIKR